MQLSKSQFTRGLQCSKSTWLYKHMREVITPITARQEFIFAIGQLIGELAQGPFPDGVEIEHAPNDVDGMIERTRALIEQGADAGYEASWKAIKHPSELIFCTVP